MVLSTGLYSPAFTHDHKANTYFQSIEKYRVRSAAPPPWCSLGLFYNCNSVNTFSFNMKPQQKQRRKNNASREKYRKINRETNQSTVSSARMKRKNSNLPSFDHPVFDL